MFKLIHDATWAVALFVAVHIAAMLPRNRGVSAVCLAYEMGQRMERKRSQRTIDETTVEFHLDPATVPVRRGHEPHMSRDLDFGA